METYHMYPVYVKFKNGNVLMLPGINKKDKNSREQRRRFLNDVPKTAVIIRATIVGVVDGHILKIGASFTSPGDRYVKRLGVLIATNKANKTPLRTLILDQPFSKDTALVEMFTLAQAFEAKVIPMSNPNIMKKKVW